MVLITLMRMRITKTLLHEKSALFSSIWMKKVQSWKKWKIQIGSVHHPPPPHQEKIDPFKLPKVLIHVVGCLQVRMRIEWAWAVVRTLSILCILLSLWYIFNKYACVFKTYELFTTSSILLTLLSLWYISTNTHAYCNCMNPTYFSFNPLYSSQSLLSLW